MRFVLGSLLLASPLAGCLALPDLAVATMTAEEALRLSQAESRAEKLGTLLIACNQTLAEANEAAVVANHTGNKLIATIRTRERALSEAQEELNRTTRENHVLKADLSAERARRDAESTRANASELRLTSLQQRFAAENSTTAAAREQRLRINTFILDLEELLDEVSGNIERFVEIYEAYTEYEMTRTEASREMDEEKAALRGLADRIRALSAPEGLGGGQTLVSEALSLIILAYDDYKDCAFNYSVSRCDTAGSRFDDAVEKLAQADETFRAYRREHAAT